MICRTAYSKEEIIKREADAIVDMAHSICLTIKDNILIPSAGIDESNGT